ncbi:MAG: AMP-binding protein [Actinomycetota bacterium]|nr:AMP-binding protein [Actinomycetota bacterium]
MPTLPELADLHDATHGDYERLHFQGRTHSSLELSGMAKRFAAGLLDVGLEPDDRVLVMLPNGPEVGTVYQAAWRAGGAVTPVLFLLSPHEVARIAREAEPTVAVTSPAFLPVVREALAGAPPVRCVVTTGPAEAGTVSFDELLSRGSLEAPVPRRDDDLAALLFTGGTTGASKGVMLTHRNIAFDAQAGAASAEIGDAEVGLTALPLAHAYGILVAATGLFVKAFGVLLPWFEPEAFLDAIERFRVTRTAVVPTMLQFLLQMPLEDHDLSSLRVVTSGAAPLPVEVIRQWEERTGSAIVEGYGCTEATAAISVERPSLPRKPGSVGLPLPGIEVRIVDEEEREVPPGDSGEICCRGPSVMAGYWRQRDETAAVLRGGWLHTGDVGRFDEEGYLYVVERKKDIIIRGGINVFPRDVEDVLSEHPDVAMAGVVGRPDEVYGEEVVAFVVPRSGSGVTEAEVLAFASERLGKHKRPQEVRFTPSLPLTPVGKVARKELRTLL